MIERGVNEMSERRLMGWVMVAVLLVVPGAAAEPAVQSAGTLVVSGAPGQAGVIQVNGKAYVGIEALARLTNGALSFKGSQITLTLPSSSASAGAAPAQNSAAAQPAASGFSRDFMKAGIEAMSVVREWRSALLNAIQNGYPVTDAWMDTYRNQAVTAMRLVGVAASTDSDRSALPLLNNELDKMQKLSAKVLAARKNMNYIAPDALKDDPLNQQILSCARSLSAMAASGQFQDDGSCD
jgi:hypothetical protein